MPLLWLLELQEMMHVHFVVFLYAMQKVIYCLYMKFIILCYPVMRDTENGFTPLG